MFAATLSGAIASTAALPAGNAATGATKAVVCQACHGANGNSANPEWPSLAGLGADYIAEQLQNFKDGKRNNPVMAPNAAPLTPDDMADLGAYFDSLVNTGLEADPSYWQAGQKLYRGGDKDRGIPACMACHGPTGRGNEPAKISGTARTTIRLRLEAAERLCVGCARNGSRRHHADHREASDRRTTSAIFLPTFKDFVECVLRDWQRCSASRWPSLRAGNNKRLIRANPVRPPLRPH